MSKDEQSRKKKVLTHNKKYRPSDFPGVSLDQITDEMRVIYARNADQIKHYKEEYLNFDNCIFSDFVREMIFIIRNTFEIPDNNERFEALLAEVIQPPVTYEEYLRVIEEATSPTFAYGIDDYGAIDLDSNGQLTWNEIEIRYGESQKKMNRMLAKERTKDSHISLTEFINSWDHVEREKRQVRQNERSAKSGDRKVDKHESGSKKKGRQSKMFIHNLKYSEKDFPGVTRAQIVQEYREAYAANKEIMSHYKESYTTPGNLIFEEFIDEFIFVLRNVSHITPSSEEQYKRMWAAMVKCPITYQEYVTMFQLTTTNRFGWGIDSFSRIDLDGNGELSQKEIEHHFGKQQKKMEKFKKLEKNQDSTISLAEFLHCWDSCAPKRPSSNLNVVIVLTNRGVLGKTGRKTGFYLPEVAHPWNVFKEAGMTVLFTSPRGGFAPMDPSSYDAYKDDVVCAKFLADSEVQRALANTLHPVLIDPETVHMIYYAGGHGPMWDVAYSQEIAELTRRVYTEHHGVIGACCHGSCGLLPLTRTTSTKPKLIENLKVTGFSNKEEEVVFGGDESLAWSLMNFSLEQALKEGGATFTAADEVFGPHIVKHKRIITGQNPASALMVGEAMVELLAILMSRHTTHLIG